MYIYVCVLGTAVKKASSCKKWEHHPVAAWRHCRRRQLGSNLSDSKGSLLYFRTINGVIVDRFQPKPQRWTHDDQDSSSVRFVHHAALPWSSKETVNEPHGCCSDECVSLTIKPDPQFYLQNKNVRHLFILLLWHQAAEDGRDDRWERGQGGKLLSVWMKGQSVKNVTWVRLRWD